jgi:hypothetical protein
MAAVPKRICYIHIGPHKTGTSSIQSFLKENRLALRKHGYLVPDSGTAVGAHHPLARKLCGQPLPQNREPAVAKFVGQLDKTSADAVIVSSEALASLLRHGDCANTFFARIGELNLEPKLVIFPRHQPQWFNSRYAEGVRSCSVSDPFANFVQGIAERLSFRYSPYLDVADTYGAELIAHPFTAETIARGVVPTFLNAIGIDAWHFQNTNVRRNEAVGPFTVAASRGVARALVDAGKQLKRRQAARCKIELGAYLEKHGFADSGYCGLTTALAREIEQLCRTDNDAFAQRVWQAGWDEVFAGDVGREFTPNDLDLCEPDEATQRRLSRAVNELLPMVEEIMRDPVLAVDEPWNDLRQYIGWMRDSAAQDAPVESPRTV